MAPRRGTLRAMKPWLLPCLGLLACGEVVELPTLDVHPEASGGEVSDSDEGDAFGADTTSDTDDEAARDVAHDAATDGIDGAVDEPPEPIALVEAALWVHAPPAEDPFAAARPAEVVCDDAGIVTEAGTLEIDTGKCNWPTLVQPLLAPVAVDATIEVVFWFGPTLAPEPGEARVELRFEGEPIWHEVFAVPNVGGFVIETVSAPRAFEAGEAALFHLHNHGANTWNLASVALVGSL